jgi:exosortase
VRGSEIQLATTALGLIFFWVGSFHACFGSKAARAAMFELGMLLWIIPIPASTIETITIALQRGSAELVDWLFALCRVPVYRDGFIFSLPGQSIEVAKQCSGIRSTLSLLFLTLILAHESLHSNWRRLILVLSALPIVVLKNGVRIVTLTLLAIYVNPSFLSGSLHHDGGIVFFLLGLVILMPIIALLRKGDKSADTPSKAMAEAAVGD